MAHPELATGNRIARLKLAKSVERDQLKRPDSAPPIVAQFWSQPHGVHLLFIRGDVVKHVPSTVENRGNSLRDQKLNKMSAYPAHVGTLLSRRRRTANSVAMATWASHGWTKVQETTGGTISTDEIQIGVIAKELAREVISVCYDEHNTMIGLIEAASNGDVLKHTYLTGVLTQPRNANHHKELVKEPTTSSLSNALQDAGININEHVLPKFEMVTLLNLY